MNGSPRVGCRWFARRLPLLAGGELAGSERRRVERHLIACSDCRARHAGLAGTLEVLRAAAGAGEAAPGGSLWPALRRQIQEERHAPGRSRPAGLGLGLGPWFDGLAGWFASRWRSRSWSRVLTTAAAAGVLAGLAAVGTELWVQRRVDTLLAEARRPIDAPVSASALAAAWGPAAPAGVSVPEAAWEPTAPPVVAALKPDRPAPVDYDLDAGTLMGPDAHERTAKASY